MNRDHDTNDFQIHRILEVQAGTPPLQDYFKSMVGADRQKAVAKLTDQLSNIGWKMTPRWRDMLVAAELMRDRGHETEWVTNKQLVYLAKRYSLPIAFYNPGNVHWTMMLNMPEKTSNGWRVSIYNPMNPGEKEQIIPSHHMNESHVLVYCPGDAQSLKPLAQPIGEDDFSIVSTTPGALSGASVIDQLERLNKLTGTYDVRIPHFTGELSALTVAKTAPLQTSEAYNCGLWCLEHAAIAWGIKPGNNIFKEKGLRQLAKDTGVVIVTPEGVMSELFHKSA